MATQVMDMWGRLRGLPGGERVFSLAFTWQAPYFRSIRPRFVQIQANYASLVLPKRRAVQNHIGTVHAIAVCNGLEAAMGALAEAVSAGRLPKLAIEKLDGNPVIGSGHEQALLSAGFSRGPRKLTATAR